MAVRHNVEGYQAFCDFIDEYDCNDKTVYILFSGSKLPSGESWCSDCEEAKPVLEEAIKKYGDSATHFIYVAVGDREYWKDLNCPFRKDDRLGLMVIPTLMKWKTPQRLDGDYCGKMDLLEMIFTED